MNETAFPNPKIHQAILDTIAQLPELELELVSLENKNNPNARFNDWDYLFNRKGSPITLNISISWPDELFCFVFLNGEAHFSLNSYLTHIGSNELVKLKARPIVERPHYTYEDCVMDSLKLLKKYLSTTLKKVARGEEWLKVPIDYMGYE